MLNFFLSRKDEPPTIDDVIEFLQSLPKDSMLCMRRTVEYEPIEISAISINDPLGYGTKSDIARVEIVLERR